MSPVPEKFQAYGEAVCAFLSHATRREKAAVRQELMDHLTDHTQALLDAGCCSQRILSTLDAVGFCCRPYFSPPFLCKQFPIILVCLH